MSTYAATHEIRSSDLHVHRPWDRLPSISLGSTVPPEVMDRILTARHLHLTKGCPITIQLVISVEVPDEPAPFTLWPELL